MRAILNSVRHMGLIVAMATVALTTGFDMFAPQASVAQAATVSRIDIRGNQRVERDTILAYITIHPGRNFGPADIDDSIRQLFKTGLFRDVKIGRQSRVLLVTVIENPIINKVNFEGNKKHKDEVLLNIISSKPRTVLTRAKVQADVQKLLAVYRASGRYRAHIEPKIIELSRNRVNLAFEITEGVKTGVSRITFIGNRHFSDGRLRDIIKTRESGLLGWLRTTDTYDPQRLEQDKLLLQQYYYRYGYADFRILSAVADLDRDKNEFYVTFTVDEGEQYTFGDINIQSSVAEIDPSTLRGAVTTYKGDVYNADKIRKTMEAIVLELSKSGYAFATVNPRGERDFENRTISVTYIVEQGARVYVERIIVSGNTRTREYVIRREFEFAEGDAYNRILIDQAKRRLLSLGFFKKVDVTTSRGSAPDRVNVNVIVEEKSTGAVSFGAGYSTLDGVVADVSLTEKNFLGRGQYVKIAVGGGENTRTYDFGFTEPFFYGYRLAAGFDLYRREQTEGYSKDYAEITTGATLRLGFQVTDEVRALLFYRIYEREIDVDPKKLGKVPPLVPLAVERSVGTTLSSVFGYALIYNTVDNPVNPHDGFYIRFNQDIAGAGGDVAYLSTTVDGTYFREILPQYDVVGSLRFTGGYIFGLGQALRTPDHFFIGGNLIRGFESNGIGPRDKTTDDTLGGRIYVTSSAEVKFPLPLLPKDLGFSGSVFVDAGTLLDPDPKSTKGDMVVANGWKIRTAIGFSLGWDSPMGPIRANFAFPVIEGKHDKTQIFRISGGRRF